MMRLSPHEERRTHLLIEDSPRLMSQTVTIVTSASADSTVRTALRRGFGELLIPDALRAEVAEGNLIVLLETMFYS